MNFSGQVVDLVHKRIYGGEIHLNNGRIVDIVETSSLDGPWILPGFIDSHVHIESSMLTPAEFGKTVIPCGTVAVLNDPHEIANVCGIDGINYMIKNSRSCPLKYFFGAPSCVPATPYETSGANLGISEIAELLKKPDIYFLSEVMNYPAVLHDETEIIEKIRLAKFYHKKIDGHAPSLHGKSLIKYISAGISTDHECTTISEARDRIRSGMKVMIREGSAAKNFDALLPLISEYPQECMFCTDDRHPSDLFSGHIDALVRKALKAGISLWDVLQVACVNPVFHYNLPLGLLQIQDPADFIVVNNLIDLEIQSVIIDGQIVFEQGELLVQHSEPAKINHFEIDELTLDDIATDPEIVYPIISATDGQIVTDKLDSPPQDGDVLKLVCVNRYKKAKPAVAYIHGFGLREGALGSSVSHDSHNILAVGYTDIDILRAVNRIIKSKGGIVACSFLKQAFLPLPIAGLMSEYSGKKVCESFQRIETLAKEFGCKLHSPMMTLSFMALLVIPKLKLSDQGLFDSEKFQFIHPR
jgi:adenine deaminase